MSIYIDGTPEERAFRKTIDDVAAQNNVNRQFAHQMALLILADGMSEPEMWEQLDKTCRKWNGRVK